MSVAYTLLTALHGIPAEVATMIIAALPITELRGAIPVAISYYHLPVISAVFWSVIGNMLPVYIILISLESVSKWLRSISPAMDRFFTKLFERTRLKLHSQVEKYGIWALAIFVAIPLPATGAWSGALAAFVFGLPKKQAFWAIFAGVVVAAVIVTILTLGVSATIGAIWGR